MAFDVNSALEQLYSDEAELKSKLEEIRAAISALKPLQKGASKTVTSELKDKKGISGRGKKAAKQTAGNDLYVPLEVPLEFKSGLRTSEKIAFVLNQFGPLSAKDIAEKINELDPNGDTQKISKNLPTETSRLKGLNRLKVYKKTGKIQTYSI